MLKFPRKEEPKKEKAEGKREGSDRKERNERDRMGLCIGKKKKVRKKQMESVIEKRRCLAFYQEGTHFLSPGAWLCMYVCMYLCLNMPLKKFTMVKENF